MLCPYVQGTQIGLLCSDSTWSSVFTHRAPRPCSVVADRPYPADIAAARHAHRHLGGARAPQRPEGAWTSIDVLLDFQSTHEAVF